ncbi:MAG TPA: 2OG-Fe(II) oxygenase [Micropepsaceae bacterium]|nr:2OG-Fe(II) oxygenase [Micropepsaceae bacterium]
MNTVARIPESAPADKWSVDLSALEAAPVAKSPFPYLIVPGFLRAEARDRISADFPPIGHPGSFPLPSLNYGPAFASFVKDLESPEISLVVGRKLGLDLSSKPTMITVRGQSRAADGKIHTDSRTKLVTALIYMNDAWESPRGRLRLVRSADNLNDVVAEVPPERGTLLLFRNDANAWHGFEPYQGPRRVVQLNWVTSASVVRKEQRRHRISAFFKRLFGRGA